MDSVFPLLTPLFQREHSLWIYRMQDCALQPVLHPGEQQDALGFTQSNHSLTLSHVQAAALRLQRRAQDLQCCIKRCTTREMEKNKTSYSIACSLVGVSDMHQLFLLYQQPLSDSLNPSQKAFQTFGKGKNKRPCFEVLDDLKYHLATDNVWHFWTREAIKYPL